MLDPLERVRRRWIEVIEDKLNMGTAKVMKIGKEDTRLRVNITLGAQQLEHRTYSIKGLNYCPMQSLPFNPLKNTKKKRKVNFGGCDSGTVEGAYIICLLHIA